MQLAYIPYANYIPMPKLTFRSGLFFRTILCYLIATAVWTTYALKWGKLTENDLDVRLPLGFLVVLALSLAVGSGRFRWDKVIALIAGVILIFLVATAVLGGLLLAIHAPVWIYFLLNSVFVAFAMTWLVGVWEDFPFRRWTIVLTGVCMLAGYLSLHIFQDALREAINNAPHLHVFLVLQTSIVFPLALGLSMKEEEVEA